MKLAVNTLPPAILLGGRCITMSMARSLGRAGVPIYALNSPDAHVRHSRYCTLLRPRGGDDPASWSEFLRGEESEPFRGAVLLACSDAEVELLVQHRAELADKFLLDLADENQLRVMNKLNTYRIGQAAGLPLPGFWTPQNRDQMEELRGELPFPLLVKPLLAHKYRKRFTRRLVIAGDFEEALKGFRTAQAAGLDVMLVEMIPGPDDRLCSYYTYLDEQGTPQFHFTKRIIRRYPEVLGG
ncbi:MAG: hypothetical protein JO112_22015, partial [Planctomycetes bacterium]|nr:hypothetical protein [Planctomycetota bacterium]